MLATVIRSADTARLYLRPLDDGTWLVASVIASGCAHDPDIALLVGRRVDAAAVLAWAAGVCSSAEVQGRGCEPMGSADGVL